MEADFRELLKNYDDTLVDLESALAPLTQQSLATLTSKLPLLERAKLYMLTTYAILSLVFSTLKINGIDAKDHPVYQELGRCKQYFEKIKAVEAANNGKEQQRRLVLDKDAAARFVKAAIKPDVDAVDQDKAKVQEGDKKRKRRQLEPDTTAGTQDEPPQEPLLGNEEAQPSTQETSEQVYEVDLDAIRKRHKKHNKRKKLKTVPKSSKDVMKALVERSDAKAAKKAKHADDG